MELPSYRKISKDNIYGQKIALTDLQIKHTLIRLLLLKDRSRSLGLFGRCLIRQILEEKKI